jgi:hypothetical protein
MIATTNCFACSYSFLPCLEGINRDTRPTETTRKSQFEIELAAGENAVPTKK